MVWCGKPARTWRCSCPGGEGGEGGEGVWVVKGLLRWLGVANQNVLGDVRALGRWGEVGEVVKWLRGY